jgi:hypothetical protein
MDTFEAFLFVAGVGGFICGAVWFFTRSLTKYWWWRAVLCLLLGASIAPACFPILGDWAVWPASAVLLNLFDGTDVLFSILVGGLPVSVCAFLVFCMWSVVIHRRSKVEQDIA